MKAQGRFPNLLIIGGMKCGTTSLHNYLNSHPEIFMSEPKEIHYYARSLNKMTEEEYKGHFNSTLPIVGTTPQSYTKCHNKYYRKIPERIKQDTPDVKLIYILRDPIERYKSHILESYHCDPLEDIEYSQQSDNYLKTSLYGMQLKAFLEYFSLKQIHLLTLEDLQRDRLKELNKIFDFLGVKRILDSSYFDFISNSADTKLVPRIIKEQLWYRILRKISSGLAIKVGSKLASVFYHDQMKKPDLSDDRISKLKEVFKKDKILLENLSGMKINNWSI